MAKVRPQNPAKTAEAMKQARFTSMSRLSKAMQKEFSLQSAFKLGYRNKEDISTLPPYVLVVGSQNVLTNAAEQVGIRNGIVLDGGAGNQNTYGIDSAYDFNTHLNGFRNLRKWGANMEVRYENPVSGDVSWINILNSLTTDKGANFTDFWSTGAPQNLCLIVNGAGQPVREWTGAIGAFASATSNTITVQGTDSLSTGLGFYNTGDTAKYRLIIDGVEYAYTSAGEVATTPFNQTPTNNNIACTDTSRSAQIFTTNANAVSLTSALVKFNATAAQTYPVNAIAEIRTDNAGVPGTLVGSANASTAAVGSPGDFSLTFLFDELTVAGNTNYHLVIYTQNGSNINVKTGTNPATGTTLSTDGGTTWGAQNGYLNAVITENDTNTTTFTGVTPDPSAAGIVVGDAIIQKPAIGIAIPDAIPTTFSIDVIATLGNQVYYGDLSDHSVYISNVNDYTSCTFSTPRVPGEGATFVLDAPPVGFIAQDENMWTSAGRDFWYQSKFVLSADLASETFSFERLKTTPNQGAQSQALMSKMKNNIQFVSFEPIFNSLGTAKDFLNSPQTTNLSDPIRNDMDAYDFTGGASYYFNYYLYLTVPQMGVVRMYNLQKKYWEAPQVLPVGRFYQVEGVLYGHSNITNESYQVFVPDVYNDNGNPIQAIAAFPYVASEGAQPNQQKSFNKIYTEGYIAGNTQLTLTVNYDFGAYSGSYSGQISGADPSIVYNKITDGSLGQNTLGTQPIGTILNLPNQNPIPKFRIINTFPPVNNYEYQLVYSSYDVDTNWKLLRFGPAIKASTDMSVSISQ